MSRCFPYVVDASRVRDESLIGSIKLQSHKRKAEKELTNEKKEKKQRKLEKKQRKLEREEKKEKKKASEAQSLLVGPLKTVDATKHACQTPPTKVAPQVENLEGSGLTEEHEKPFKGNLCYLSDGTQPDGTQQSNKRPREVFSEDSQESNGKPFRVRFTLKKLKFDVDAENLCSTSGLVRNSRPSPIQNNETVSVADVRMSHLASTSTRKEEKLPAKISSGSTCPPTEAKLPKKVCSTTTPKVAKLPEIISSTSTSKGSKLPEKISTTITTKVARLLEKTPSPITPSVARLPEKLSSTTKVAKLPEKISSTTTPRVAKLPEKISGPTPPRVAKLPEKISGPTPPMVAKLPEKISGPTPMVVKLPEKISGPTPMVAKLPEKISRIADDCLYNNGKKHKQEPVYKALFEDWCPIPLSLSSEQDGGDDWLLPKKQKQTQINRTKTVTGDITSLYNVSRSSNLLGPKACYLPAADIYALPYTLPF